MQLMEAPSASANWLSYAQVVKEKAQARLVIERAEQAVKLASTGRLSEFIGRNGHFNLTELAAPPDTLATQTVCLTEVEAQRVEWLWPGYIPFGMVTVLQGDPGMGKGTLTLDLTARLSRGCPFPLLEAEREPMNTLLLTTAEDDLARTIKPRLQAAGADCSRVFAFPDLLTLPGELTTLESHIRHHQAKLVIIDPLNAYLSGTVDGHKDQDVRRALSPLKAVAEKTGAAIVLVHHLNKGAGSALYRGGGSIGIAGAARSVLLVAPHPQDEGQRVLCRVKGNLSELPPALAFSLENASPYAVPRVEWHGVTEYTADELVAPPSRTEESLSRIEQAMQFYREALAEGERPSEAVEQEREEAAIPERTAKRARKALGVRSRKEGFAPAIWYVSLPREQVDESHEECQNTPKSANNSL
jgi:hypothetical protein